MFTYKSMFHFHTHGFWLRQQCAEFANFAFALGDTVLRATSQNEKELVTFLHSHFIMTFQETKKKKITINS